MTTWKLVGSALMVCGAAALGACGDDDGDDGGGDAGESSTTGGRSNTGGSSSAEGGDTSSEGGTPSDGGDSGTGGTGTFTPGECPEGQFNYYDIWYGSESCGAYYDCLIEYSCMDSPDEAECIAQSEAALQSFYCYPVEMEPDEAALEAACAQILASITEQYNCD